MGNNINIEPIGDQIGGSNCPITQNDTYPCFPVCDWIHFEGSAKRSCFDPKAETYESKMPPSGVLVWYNEKSEALNLVVNKGEEGGIIFNLADVYGNNLIEKKAEISSGENRYIIDTSKLINGVYLYQVIFEEKVIHTGKVMILR